jgi:uncharacterized protein (DUF2384 family)
MKPKNHNPSVKRHHLHRLSAGIRTQIKHYQRCLTLVRYVDEAVLSAGMDIFSSDAALALWLCEPTETFRGKAPLLLARTAKGRKQIVNALRRIAAGIP